MENEKIVIRKEVPWWIWMVSLIILIVVAVIIWYDLNNNYLNNNNNDEKEKLTQQIDSLKAVQAKDDFDAKQRIEVTAYLGRETANKTNNEKIIINMDSSAVYKYDFITKYKSTATNPGANR